MPLFPEAEERPSYFPSAATLSPTGLPGLPSMPGAAGPTSGMFSTGLPGSLEQAAAKYQASAVGQHMTAERAAMFDDAAIGPPEQYADFMQSSDPSMADPTAQYEANAAGLAKLATVNPEFAEQLALKLQGQPEEDKGFGGNLLDMVGDIAMPALAVGGKALDLLGRPLKAVYELANTDDEGDSWYEDIGQALSGKSRLTGDAMVRKWGGEDLPGWAQAVAGFGLDVALDPVTWVTFGMAGVSRAAMNKGLGKAAGRLGAEQYAETTAGKLLMKEIGPEEFTKYADDISGHLSNYSRMSKDGADALTMSRIENAPREMIDMMRGQMDPLTRAANRRGLKRSLSPEDFKKYRPLLEAKAKQIGGREGRGVAAALGGTRIRAGIPFTNLRYTSRAAPGTYGLGFGRGRDFFRGMGGLKQLEKYAQKHPELGAKVMSTFFDPNGGWDGVAKQFPGLVEEMGNGFGKMAMTPYRSASEMVGRQTRRLSTNTALFRNGGIAELKGMGIVNSAKASEKSLQNYGGTYVDNQGTKYEGHAFQRHLQDGMSEDPEQMAKYQDVLDSFPPEVDPTADSIAEWVALQRANIETSNWTGNPEDKEMALNALDTSERSMTASIADLNGKELERIRALASIQGGMVGKLADEGIHQPRLNANYDSVRSLQDTPEQMGTWQVGTPNTVKELEFHARVGGNGGIGYNEAEDSSELAQGIQLTSKPTIADSSMRTEAEPTVTKLVRGTDGPVGPWSDEELDALPDGGFTVDATSRKEVSVNGAYAVGDRSTAKVIDKSDADWRDQVRLWMAANEDQLARKEYQVGGWQQGDTFELNVTNVVKDETQARALGHHRGEVELYDGTGGDPRLTLEHTAKVKLRTRNPLMLDARKTAGGAETGANRTILDDWKTAAKSDIEEWIDRRMLKGDGTIEKQMEAVGGREEFVKLHVSRGVADKARHEGYDAIVEYTDDGVRAVSITPEAGKAWNVKQMSDKAPLVRPHRGYGPRVLTDHGRKVMGMAGDERHVLVSDLKHAKERNLDEMTWSEANDFLKKKYKSSEDILERSPIKSHGAYVDRMASEARRHHLARGGHQLTHEPAGGAAVSNVVWQTKAGTLAEKNLAKMEKGIQTLHAKGEKKRHQRLLALDRQTTTYIDEVDRQRNMLLRLDDRGRAAVQVRRSYAATAKEADELGQELQKALKFRSVGRQKLKAALERIEGGPTRVGDEDIPLAGKSPSQAAQVKKLEAQIDEGQRQIDDIMERRRALHTGRRDAAAQGGRTDDALKGFDIADTHASGAEQRTFTITKNGKPVAKLEYVPGTKRSAPFGMHVEVKAEYQRQGVGKAMVKRLEKKLGRPLEWAEEAENTPAGNALIRSLQTDTPKLDVHEMAAEAAAKVMKEAQDRSTKRGVQVRLMEDRVKGVAKEVDKLQFRYKQDMAQMRPAMLSGRTKVGAGRSLYKDMGHIPGMEGVSMHQYMAAEFEHALGKADISDFRKQWRKFAMGPWKRWSTIYYPGFHARNFMGAFFNNAIGGVTPANYFDNHILHRLINKGEKHAMWNKVVKRSTVEKYGIGHLASERGGDVLWRDFANYYDAQEIRSFNSGVMRDVMGSQRTLTSTGTKGRLDKAATKAQWLPRKLTETTENLFRGSAWLQGMEATGGDLVGARAFTMMRHGDYDELTDAEEFIKDLVPFYKWMRTNIPFQVHALLETPGRTMATVKAGHATFVAAGLDEQSMQEKMPTYQKEQFMVGMPKGVGDLLSKVPGLSGMKGVQMMAMDLPMSDLHAGADDYLSSMVPMLRPLLESGVFKSRMGPDGGAVPLEGRVPVENTIAAVPGMSQVLGQFGLIKKDTSGRETMDARWVNLTSAIPVFSRFKDWIFEDENRQDARAKSVWSILLGVRPEAQGQKELLAAEQRMYYDNIEPAVEQMRDLGMPLPSIDTVLAEVWTDIGLEAPVEETESILPGLPGTEAP